MRLFPDTGAGAFKVSNYNIFISRRNFPTNLYISCAEKAQHPGSIVPNPTEYAMPQRIKRQAGKLASTNLVTDRWDERWHNDDIFLHQFLASPTSKPIGFNLHRKPLVQLNPLRCGHAKSNIFLYKIGAAASELCVSGTRQSVQQIISSEGMMTCKNLYEDTVERLMIGRMAFQHGIGRIFSWRLASLTADVSKKSIIKPKCQISNRLTFDKVVSISYFKLSYEPHPPPSSFKGAIMAA